MKKEESINKYKLVTDINNYSRNVNKTIIFKKNAPIIIKEIKDENNWGNYVITDC